MSATNTTFKVISGLSAPHEKINITRNADYNVLYSQLQELALAYSGLDITLPLSESLSKSATQLIHITEDMNLLPAERLVEFKNALRFVDYAYLSVVNGTRGEDADAKVNTKLLNPYEINYEQYVFGVKPKEASFAKLYQTICSESSLRHCAKKAHKMLYLHFKFPENDFVTGAVKYAAFMYDSLTKRKKPVETALVAYIWTLDTFFNALQSLTHDAPDVQGVDVVPKQHSFHYMHQLSNIDNLSNVNNYVIKNNIDVNELEKLNDTFEAHLYDLPKFRYATSIQSMDARKFYNHNDVRNDLHSTKAFTEAVAALQGCETFEQAFEALYILDAFEVQFISRNKVNVTQCPITFENEDAAIKFCKELNFPEGVDRYNIIYMLIVKNAKGEFELTPLQLIDPNAQNEDAYYDYN